MKEDKATQVLENEFPLIPMNDIDDMARKIAVSWMECEDKNWIGQKHKLASDIMNYHRIKSATQQEYIKSLEDALKWYADSRNYLSGYQKGETLIDENAGLASAYSDKRIENIAKQALNK